MSKEKKHFVTDNNNNELNVGDVAEHGFRYFNLRTGKSFETDPRV